MTLFQRLDKLLDDLAHAEDMSLQSALREVFTGLRRKLAEQNLDDESPQAEIVVVIIQERAGTESNHRGAGK